MTFGTSEFVGARDADRTQNETNAFFWPARNTAKDPATKERAYDDVEDVVEMQLHIGSKVMPQYPIHSLAEVAYRLDQALDLTASTEGISIHPGRYRNDQIIIGLDCEKAGSGPGGGVSYTGVSTSSGGGATIRLEMKNIKAFAGDADKTS